jgi:hypothetical protein
MDASKEYLFEIKLRGMDFITPDGNLDEKMRYTLDYQPFISSINYKLIFGGGLTDKERIGEMMPSSNQTFEYDVAISFAGENRQIAQQLFQAMMAIGVKVFYDQNEAANMWGKDSIEVLADVYANKARFCLMLISKYYPEKPWTRLERISAQNRALRQPTEYILPIRLDDTEVPGLPPSISYLDLRHFSIEEVVESVLVKLGRDAQAGTKNASSLTVEPGKYQIPIPQIARSYTQLDKDRFIENAFEVMKAYFRQALSELKQQYPETETDLKEINAVKFVARIYVRGRLQCQCKIWLGSSFGQQSIAYVEGSHIDIGNDNLMNEYLSVDQTQAGLGLKVSGFALGLGGIKPDQEVVSVERSAEYFWRRFSQSLGNY